MDITLHCNACKTIVTQKDDLKGYSTVWIQPDGIVIIVCLHLQKKN